MLYNYRKHDSGIYIPVVVPHVQNALYFRRKVRALYYVNALYVFLGFSFSCVLKLNLK